MDVSRYLNIAELKFTIEFVTPTFLGGPDGNAQIRTAPFKSLLRRWWRIVNGNLTPEELWQKESNLFGSAEENPRTKEDFGKSKVLLEIDSKNTDAPQNYNLCVEYNDSVKQTMISSLDYGYGKNKKSPLKYLAFGPYDIKNGHVNNYIKENTKIPFVLKIPNDEKTIEEFIAVLTLINNFGTIGGRSKKGFGSITVISVMDKKSNKIKLKNIKELRTSYPQLTQKIDFNNKNTKQYPYCIGIYKDNMTCWSMKKEFDTWKAVSREFYNLYTNIQREIKKVDPKYAKLIFGASDLSSYKDITDIKNEKIKRVPSQLIFKILKNQNGKYTGRIIHLPYNINSEITTQTKVWNRIYEILDSEKKEDGQLLFGRFGGNKK